MLIFMNYHLLFVIYFSFLLLHFYFIFEGGYIALSTMLGQMVGSCISGILENSYPRKNILIASLLLGSLAATLFGIIRNYPVLLLLRVVTGGCQGAIVPVLFSLIGDFYSIDERATYSAIVSSSLGGGMMLGQLFTGYSLGTYVRSPYLHYKC